MVEIDKIDRKIIELIKENCKLSTRKIAKKNSIPITTVYNRIKRLETEGVIKKYSAVIDEKKIGKILTAYILIRYDVSNWGKKPAEEELKKQLICLPNIEEVKFLLGRYEILLKIHTKDIKEIRGVILGKLRDIPGVGNSETFVVLEDVK